MGEPVGLSFLYPAVPILCILSMFSLLILASSFWKTRIFALNAFLGWLLLGDLLVFIGMVQWRGNIHDSPVWADLLAALGNIWNLGTFGTGALVSKFVALRLRPLSGRELLDSRRKHNRIDALFSIGLPLLWIPTFLLSCSGRYWIIEDIGPVGSTWIDAWGFVLVVLPTSCAALAIAVFNVMALVTYWRGRQTAAGSELSKRTTSSRTKKLLAFSFANMLLSLFAIGYSVGKWLHYYPVSEWDAPNPIAENITYLTTTRYMTRFLLDTVAHISVDGFTSHSISIPLMGLYFFSWFGFGAEARKSYREAFNRFLRMISFRSQAREHLVEGSVWRKIVQRLRCNGGAGDVLPTMTSVTPFSLTSPTPDNMQLPAELAPSYSSSSGSSFHNKRGEKTGLYNIVLPFHREALSPTDSISTYSSSGISRFGRCISTSTIVPRTFAASFGTDTSYSYSFPRAESGLPRVTDDLLHSASPFLHRRPTPFCPTNDAMSQTTTMS